MKYYTDSEFIEGIHEPLFGKRRHFIDMISIGIVAQDGREYQAISSEYRYKDASPWVRENVIAQLYKHTVSGDQRNRWNERNFHKVYGKPNKQIAQEIVAFVTEKEDADFSIGIFGEKRLNSIKTDVSFAGYYADYDHVLFCSLFGTMMDLPDGFPKYCIDLKQTLDEVVRKRFHTNSKESFEKALEEFKKDPAFPKQQDEHLAISDARWNKKLDEYLQKQHSKWQTNTAR